MIKRWISSSLCNVVMFSYYGLATSFREKKILLYMFLRLC